MYIDDIKLFAKTEKEQENLIHAVRIYSQDIGMEFDIEKCAMQDTENGRRHLTEWNYQIRTRLARSEKRNVQILGILETDTIKQVEMKEKIKKNTLGELENYWRQDYLAETLSKESIPELYLSLDIREPF